MLDSAVVQYAIVSSPIGDLIVSGEDGLVRRLDFGDSAVVSADWRRDDAAFTEVADQLQAYFAGQLRQFDVLLAPLGTAFQQRVWQALTRIPFGVTTSYGHLASELGDPRAVRAVGLANGRNPIAIMIPCHRVIGANGNLTGYGGGLDRKRWLLAHERGEQALTW